MPLLPLPEGARPSLRLLVSGRDFATGSASLIASTVSQLGRLTLAAASHCSIRWQTSRAPADVLGVVALSNHRRCIFALARLIALHMRRTGLELTCSLLVVSQMNCISVKVLLASKLALKTMSWQEVHGVDAHSPNVRHVSKATASEQNDPSPTASLRKERRSLVWPERPVS